MASRLSRAFFASIFLCAASGAEAGTLTAATWSQVTEGFPMNRSGAQLGITGSSTATSIAVSLVYPAFSTAFFVPKTANGVFNAHVTITQGGAQALTATPSMGNATMGVPGTVVLMDATHNEMGVNQSTSMVGLYTLAKIPLNVGVADQAISTFVLFGAQHSQTVDFYAWTPGTLSFTGLTSNGAALPSVVAMGSFNLTAMGGGTVTLVSPTKVSKDGVYFPRRAVSVTTLKMYFVPEPSTLLLLAAAGAALALHGTRARR
jgi:hypothetical protein